MTDDEINRAWSKWIATLAVDAMLDAKIVARPDMEKAIAIAEEEIYVRLALGDRPDRTNRNLNFPAA
jgi:hypothetical protein